MAFVSHQVVSAFRAASASVVSRGRFRRLAPAVVCGMGLLAVAGCSHSDRPELGRVHGHITMDDKPLVRAGVGFQPKVKGRESYGTTDANGEYEMNYLPGVKGAGVGENVVRVTTQRTSDPRTETVPAKYNKQTTLRFGVKAGEDNVADFDLKSK